MPGEKPDGGLKWRRPSWNDVVRDDRGGGREPSQDFLCSGIRSAAECASAEYEVLQRAVGDRTVPLRQSTLSAEYEVFQRAVGDRTVPLQQSTKCSSGLLEVAQNIFARALFPREYRWPSHRGIPHITHHGLSDLGLLSLSASQRRARKYLTLFMNISRRS